ncbi:MAG: hypothetical protein EBW14_12015 [Oxalobacteraceae bacterium]|nr:hypothetical protein [Oxalobacteraceae bacterium]
MTACLLCVGLPGEFFGPSGGAPCAIERFATGRYSVGSASHGNGSRDQAVRIVMQFRKYSKKPRYPGLICTAGDKPSSRSEPDTGGVTKLDSTQQ